MRPKDEIDLTILPMSDLKPHEATIPELLDSVRTDILKSGYQRDPILVDRRTKVVLDGMHRRAALESIGARFVLCALFDYRDRNIILERWLRYFLPQNRSLIRSIVDLLDLKKSNATPQEAMKRVEEGASQIALLSRRDTYLGSYKSNIFQVYEKVGEFDRLCRSARFEIQFIQESQKLEVFSSDSVYVLYPKALSKSDVLKIARSGHVLPFKTTRHILPLRPMGVYFPTATLIEAKSRRECMDELSSILQSSKVEVLEREGWYEGRRYSEPIAIYRRKRLDWPL